MAVWQAQMPQLGLPYLGLPALTVSTGVGVPRAQRAEALARLGRLHDAKGELAATALEPVSPADWPDTLVARMSSVRGLIAAAEGDSAAARRHLQHAADGWRRRVDHADATGSTAALADLGRPVIGQISPAEELEAVLADLASLDLS